MHHLPDQSPAAARSPFLTTMSVLLVLVSTGLLITGLFTSSLLCIYLAIAAATTSAAALHAAARATRRR